MYVGSVLHLFAGMQSDAMKLVTSHFTPPWASGASVKKFSLANSFNLRAAKLVNDYFIVSGASGDDEIILNLSDDHSNLNKDTKITHGFTPLQIQVMEWDCNGGTPACPSGRKLYILSKSSSQNDKFKVTVHDLRSISDNEYDV